MWNKDRRTCYKIDEKKFKELMYVKSDIEPLKKRKFSKEELENRYESEDIKKIIKYSIKCEDIYWPKEEYDLSDFVKLHLEDDLKGRIITDRETEILRKQGSGQGEQIDIQVRVVTQDKVITVIIEVKGCWNKGLYNDITNQLAERYLKDYPACQHGLYLVGWFNCHQWDEKDYRNDDAKKFNSIDELQKLLTQQAESLSQEGLHIKACVYQCITSS